VSRPAHIAAHPKAHSSNSAPPHLSPALSGRVTLINISKRGNKKGGHICLASEQYSFCDRQAAVKWCRKRESNPQLIITNDLLYHLTIAATVYTGRRSPPPPANIYAYIPANIQANIHAYIPANIHAYIHANIYADRPRSISRVMRRANSVRLAGGRPSRICA